MTSRYTHNRASLIAAALALALLGPASFGQTIPLSDQRVSIETDDEVASEISLLAVIDPARFQFSRSGDLSYGLTVFFSVHGSATGEVDYVELPTSVQIPAGQRSVTFYVNPKSDQLEEGMETVVIRLEPSPMLNLLPGYKIDPSGREAVAVILDNGSFPTPGVEIVRPKSGEQFGASAPLEVVAAAYHPTRDVWRVEFHAGAVKIGESLVVNLDPVMGGLIIHRFVWANPPVGVHILTARGFDGSQDSPLVSDPVRITVGPNVPQPIVGIEATGPIAEESSFPLPRPKMVGEFTISRTGQTAQPLNVLVRYSGMATSGDDYGPMPQFVTIPAGATSTVLPVPAVDDDVTEGIETLIATLSHCAPGTDPPSGIQCVEGFDIDPARQSATVFMRDDGGDPPADREVHGVGVYTGTAPDGGVSQNNEQGDASVRVDRPGKQVTLLLSSYEPVLWHVTVSQGTVLEKVILGGYYPQEVEGVAAGVEIVPGYLQGGVDEYLYLGYTIEAAQFYRTLPQVCALTGLDLSSFQGSYQAPYPQPFVIDRVQDDVRLQCNYPQPVPLSDLPNLNFRLAFHALGGGGDVFFQNYTLGGPQIGQRLLPAARVIGDSGGRFYYATESQSVFKVDSQTGETHEMAQPPDLAREGWPMGAAFDTARQRVLVVSLGAEGFLHAYSPAQDQWSLVTSMDNLDLDCLEYHASGDALYGIGVTWGDSGGPSLYEFNPDGVLRKQFPLPLQPFGIGPIGYQSELVSVGDYLVLLLEPGRVFGGAGIEDSRMYLIDPRSGEVRLTYRKVGLQPNRPPVVTILTPTDGRTFDAGATIELGAEVSDPDGNLSAMTKVEFFANGGKVAEALGPTTAPIRWMTTWTNVPNGRYTLTARGSDVLGATAISAPVRITVGPVTPRNDPPTVAITRPTNGSKLPLDTPIEIVAAARDVDGFVRTVEFFADGRKIGEMGVGFVDPPEPDPAQTFHFVWHQPGPGPHTLMARATDNRGAVGPSPAVGIHVGPSDLLPFVTVTAHDSFAVEPGLEETVETAAFRIHRFGSDAEPLVVAYSLGGSAQNGTDYQELSGLATIPAGMPSVEVVVRPLGDALSEGVETVVLQLAPSPAPSPQIPESNSYQIGQPWAAAAVISDTQLAPVPGVAQLAALPNNLLHLCFAAETGQAYRLEASTDLLTWETLSDTVSTNNACHFIDPEMSNHPLRFYRLAPE